MPRSNVTAKQKLDAVKKILSGRKSKTYSADLWCSSFFCRRMDFKYQIKGEKAFSDKFQKVEYSKEVQRSSS